MADSAEKQHSRKFFLNIRKSIGRAKRTPHWGCSIEISCDIYPYVGIYISLSTKNTYAKMRGRNYVAKTHACSKLVLGS